MPFTKETAIYGGAKPGAGRKKGTQAKIEKAASEIAREFIESNVRAVLDTYLGLASGTGKFGIDPPTTRHFVDKLIPEIDGKENQRPIAIQVIVEGQDVSIKSQGSGGEILVGSD